MVAACEGRCCLRPDALCTLFLCRPLPLQETIEGDLAKKGAAHDEL